MVVEAPPVEKEVFGVTYERYALQQLAARLVRRLNLRSVLEMPASGAKAMPGLYSLGFALAGCDVSLLEAPAEALPIWSGLGMGDRLTALNRTSLEKATAEGQKWDIVWNFAVLPLADDPAELLQNMARCSRGWVLIIAVNRFNYGFGMHRAVHRLHRIPWTHGDLRFFSPFSCANYVRRLGFSSIRWGVLDCPPWPDSPGFRDLRLHRRGDKPCRWESPYLEHLRVGKFPLWVRALYRAESLPLPARIKLPFAHLYYLICRVPHEAAA